MRKLEYVNGQWSLYSIENLVLLFIKTFQDSSALLPSWNTMEQWELVFFPYLKLSAFGKYLCCDRPTMDNSVLFRSIFKEIIQKYILSTSNTTKKILNKKTQRILVFKATRLTALRELVAFRASVPQVFFTGWTEKWPNSVSPVIPKCLW